jgi:hypothetical protein
VSEVLRDDKLEAVLRAVLPLVLDRELCEVMHLLLAVLANRGRTGNGEDGEFGLRLLEDEDAGGRLFMDQHGVVLSMAIAPGLRGEELRVRDNLNAVRAASSSSPPRAPSSSPP